MTHSSDNIIPEQACATYLINTLSHFCIKHDIKNAQISGIGAIEDIELGVFDQKQKKYLKKNFASCYELISCQGNVSLKDNKPFCHIHITIGDHNFQVL